MTYVEDDGPPDIDATHAFAALADLETAALVNDQGEGAETAPYAPTLPWIKLLRSPTGWGPNLPDHDDFSAPCTLAPGEILYPGEELGKTLVYECEARAITRESLRGAVAALYRVLRNAMNDPVICTVTPYIEIGGPVWMYSARVRPGSGPDAIAHFPKRRAPWRQTLTFSLRMNDANFYVAEDFVVPDPIGTIAAPP